MDSQVQCLKNKNGKDFELKLMHDFHDKGFHVRTMKSLNCIVCGLEVEDAVIQQYPLLDSTESNTKVDFYYKNNAGKEIYIECKNQNTSGSVDQKLFYYLVQMQENIYNGPFVMYINNTYAGSKKKLEYFVKKYMTYNSHVIYERNIDDLVNLMKDEQV